MDKKFLKENNLYEAHKQFMRLCEASYVLRDLEEADDDEQQQDGQGADPSAQGGMPPMGGDPNAQGGDPNVQGGMPPMGGDDPNAQGGMPPMGGDDPNAQGGMPPMGDEGMGGDPSMGGEMPPMGDEGMGAPEDDEEVIDVDDITNAQEKMNAKVNTVGKDVEGMEDKIASLMQSLENMQAMIDKNNANIESFKQEFEKRNPTQTEKLNLRSLDSYPFNVSPTEYWRGKNATSNYQSYSDNDEPTTQEYEITNNDVDNFDEKNVEDSFKIDDDLLQDINKIFGI